MRWQIDQNGESNEARLAGENDAENTILAGLSLCGLKFSSLEINKVTDDARLVFNLDKSPKEVGNFLELKALEGMWKEDKKQ